MGDGSTKIFRLVIYGLILLLANLVGIVVTNIIVLGPSSFPRIRSAFLSNGRLSRRLFGDAVESAPKTNPRKGSTAEEDVTQR
jgi:hypothetical protein